MLDMMNANDTLVRAENVASDTVDTFTVTEKPVRRTTIFGHPIERWFTAIVGGPMLGLGLLGLVPAFTQGGALFGLFHVDFNTTLIHLLTGLVGLAIFKLDERYPKYRLAFWFAVNVAWVYTLVFSDGNIAFGALGNVAGQPTLFGLFQLRLLPWVMANGAHVTLGLVGFIVAAVVMLQAGAQATAKARSRTVEYRSHTMLRQPAARS